MCRDMKLRLFDTRAGGEAVRIADGHGGGTEQTRPGEPELGPGPGQSLGMAKAGQQEHRVCFIVGQRSRKAFPAMTGVFDVEWNTSEW